MPWTACLFLRETRVGKQMCGSGCCTCRSWYKFPELWADKLWQQQVIANQWESGLVQGDEREDFPARGQKRKKKCFPNHSTMLWFWKLNFCNLRSELDATKVPSWNLYSVSLGKCSKLVILKIHDRPGFNKTQNLSALLSWEPSPHCCMTRR